MASRAVSLIFRLPAGRAAALALGLLGCSSEDEPLAEPPAPVEETFSCPFVEAVSGETVVLVRDRGFDLGNKVFEGRVGGCYTIRCTGGDGEAAEGFEQAKKSTIKALGRRDERCRLEPGITLRRSPAFASIAGRREPWNAAIEDHESPLFAGADRVGEVVGGDAEFFYHGTAVAGLIAQDNPAVRLVIVSDESILSSAAEPPCPEPAALQREIDLYSDPDVRAAVLASPLGRLDEDLLRVVRDHRVAVSNESFGILPRAELEARCPGPWRRYFEVFSGLEAARLEALAGGGVFEGISVLTLRAAGNDGLTIDTPADSFSCGGPGQPDAWGPASATLSVGALDSTSWAYAGFSNRGDCVDVFAPGLRIVSWGPEDFRGVWSGTSLSAPLVARLASTLPAAPASGRRAALVALLDEQKRLPSGSFPASSQFDRPTAAARMLPPLRARLPGRRRGW